MIQFIIAAIVFAIAIVGMALALHFSKYKKRAGACCGGEHCDTDKAQGDSSCHREKLEFVKKYGEAKIKTDSI